MPIDPNIISGIKQFRPNIPNPIDQYGKSLTLKSLMRQDEQAQKSMASAEELRQMYADSGNNPEALKANLLKRGMFNEAKSLDEYMQSQSAQTSRTAYGETLPEGERQMFGADPKAFIKGKIESGVRKPNMHVIETPTGQEVVDLNDPNAQKKWGAKPSNKSTPMAPVAYVNEKGETVWGTIAEAKGRPAANYSPTVQGQVAGAKASKKETGQSIGESQAKLADIEAMMPRLETVAKELSELGKKATYTMAGQASDFTKRQLGIGVGEGAVARKEYISKVDNEILPLLRQTFGAQFTQKEGESLKATLGDTNASPEEKDAVLKSFIETKYGQIAALQRRTGAQPSGAYDGDKEARYQAWKAQQGR